MTPMKRHVLPCALSVLTLALAGCLDGSDSDSDGDSGGGPGGQPNLTLSMLSSNPDQVSGDSVLVTIEGDADLTDEELADLEFWINDQQAEPVRLVRRNGQVEILLSGIQLGDNQLELHHTDHGPLNSMTLTSYPVTGPMFSGPQQYPFVCTSVSEFGKQPLVDTDSEPGFPVYDANGDQIGLSKDCSIEPFVTFFIAPPTEFTSLFRRTAQDPPIWQPQR